MSSLILRANAFIVKNLAFKAKIMQIKIIEIVSTVNTKLYISTLQTCREGRRYRRLVGIRDFVAAEQRQSIMQL